MWMCTPPSSTIRRASAANSSGLYGIAGHCSRLAIAPEIAQVMTAGSSMLMLHLISCPALPQVERTTSYIPGIGLEASRRRGGPHLTFPLGSPLEHKLGVA